MGTQADLRRRPAVRWCFRHRLGRGVGPCLADRVPDPVVNRRLGLRAIGDGLHQSHVRAGGEGQAAELLELRQRRCSRDRHRARRSAGGSGGVEGDLRHPGPDVSYRVPARLVAASRDGPANWCALRHQGVADPRRGCRTPSRRHQPGPVVGLVEPRHHHLLRGVGGVDDLVRESRTARSRPPRGAGLVPHAQHRLPRAQPTAHQLRLHGWTVPYPPGARQPGPRLRRVHGRLPGYRPAAGLLAHRPPRRAGDPEGRREGHRGRRCFVCCRFDGVVGDGRPGHG